MRLLVLGGTRFLSRTVAVDALRRGHEVTCAARGVTGDVPAGARHVRWDRDGTPVPDELVREDFDAVVDVARHPSWVRTAVAALPDAHWTFVSTINVYADDSLPGGTPDTLPLHEPIHTDEDPTTAPETYGAMKVSCEQAVQQAAASSFVVRPGLIVGPGDPTGRFTYWPARLAPAQVAERGEVLAPGDPDDLVQVIDVRDLAAWIVDAAEQRLTGVFDGTSAAMTRRDLLSGIATGLGVDPTFTWVDQDFLAEQGVEPWAGDRALPVWLPLPEYAGLMSHDVSASYAAGLSTRPIGETARDTLEWLSAEPDAALTGISREDEDEVIAAYRARRV